jgi:hypothetical protein
MVPPIRNDTNGMGLISMSERDVKRIQVLAEVRAGKRDGGFGGGGAGPGGASDIPPHVAI